jgi:gliding motility-associated-like protein
MSPTAFLIDRCGNIFISGWGQSPGMGAGLIGFPTTSDALQQTPSSDNADFFLFVMDRSFSNMIYGSHLGGGSAREHVDGGTSRFDRAGVVYQSVCGGCGGSSDFPTTAGAWSNSNLSSNCNNLVFKFDFQLDTHAEFTFSDTLACAGVEVQLLNNSTSYSSFFWVLDNGDTSYVFEPLVQYDLPGTYEIKLIVTDSTCLTVDTALYTVTVGKNIDLSTNGSFVFCNDIDTMIVADSKGEADFFIWSTNRDFTDTLNVVGVDSNFMASVNSNRWYYVYAESGPCNKMDSVQFTQIQGALTLADVVSICSPESGFTSVELVDPTLNFQYTWTPAIIIQGPNDEATVTFQTDSSQYIHLTAFFNSSCIIEDSFFVDVHTLDPTILSATAVPDTLPMGGMVQLNVQPSGYSYIWTPESVVSDVNAQSPTAKVDQNTKFDVLISDGVCAKNATVSVVVYDFICGRPGVYVPNAFSPNGDGNNDVLYVRSPIVNEVLFRVFSRWGELLFETTEMSKGWDGRHKGKLMDPDTYDYYLKVVCVDGQENMLKGNVTLLR